MCCVDSVAVSWSFLLRSQAVSLSSQWFGPIVVTTDHEVMHLLVPPQCTLHTSSSLLLTVPPTRWMHGMLRRPDMQAVLDLPQCCAIYVNWCLLFCAYIPEIGTLFLKDPQWQAGTFFNYCVKATGIVKHSLHVCCAALAAVPGLKLPILLILLPRLSVITLYTLVTAGDHIGDGDCDSVMQVSPVSKYSYVIWRR